MGNSTSSCYDAARLYAFTFDANTITWRSGGGDIDIERIVASTDTHLMTATQQSTHVSDKGWPPGTSWSYTKIGNDGIQVRLGEKTYNLVRCPR